jgi:hypothetical protein
MKLRKLISESLEKIFVSNIKEATSQILQERELRKVLVGVIAEAGAEVVPHRSTGINVLEDLLKKIIPTIEQDYKKLTTSPEQRDAFKSHIVNAIQNSLAPLRAAEEAGEPVMDIDEDINVMILEWKCQTNSTLRISTPMRRNLLTLILTEFQMMLTPISMLHKLGT